MSTEENKAIMRRLFDEVWNTGKLDKIEELYAPGFVADYRLYQRMMEARPLRGLSEKTQRGDADAVKGLARYSHRSPDQLDQEALRQGFLVGERRELRVIPYSSPLPPLLLEHGGTCG